MTVFLISIALLVAATLALYCTEKSRVSVQINAGLLSIALLVASFAALVLAVFLELP
jgi:CHASE2 domain-containing sensor protein